MANLRPPGAPTGPDFFPWYERQSQSPSAVFKTWRDGDGTLRLPNRYWSEDLSAARGSIARLARLDIGTILFAHRPPLASGGRALRELGERLS